MSFQLVLAGAVGVGATAFLVYVTIEIAREIPKAIKFDPTKPIHSLKHFII